MPQLFIAGDSTAADYAGPSYPMTGWAQLLPAFLQQITVVNLAQCGRSSKSYIEEGWLAVIQREMKAGDYLLIQFGHNDSKKDTERRTEPYTSYQQYLSRYLEAARERGATPILLSPVARRSFENGVLVNSHGDYPAAMQALAEQTGTAFVDMTAKTEALYRSLGEENSRALFTNVTAGEFPGYPEGHSDNTHFCRSGARQIAALAVEGLREILPAELFR